jgi:hypothetical protein
MKFIFAAAILLSSLSSFADENTLNTAVDASSEAKTYTMEPTISMSSINEGTKFIGVALLADVVSWFSIGLEGDLPLEFEKQDQIYNARILGRFHLLKTDQNNIFVQGAITQGFYNGNDVTEFATVGAAIGFMQNINENWDIGARLGAEYAQARFENGYKTDQDTFYNRLSVVGAYHF